MEELKVLRAFFQSEQNALSITEKIKPHHFTDPILTDMYNEMLHLLGKNVPLSMDIYFGKLHGVMYDGVKQNIRSQEHVSDEELLFFIGEMREDSLKRSILSISSEARIAFAEGLSGSETLERLLDKLFVTSTEASNTTYHTTEDLIGSVIHSITQKEEGYWKTGIDIFDREIGGLEKESFWCMVAASGIGKTAFSMNMAKRIAELYPNDVRVVFFSLEMGIKALSRRWVSYETGISEKRLMMPKKLEAHEVGLIMNLHSKIPFTITSDVRNIDGLIAEIRSQCFKHKNRKHIFIIDNLDKIGSHLKDVNERVADTTLRLENVKDLTKSNIILLHHITKEAESPGNKDNFYIPSDIDFRGSGKLKDNVDILTYFIRPDNYLDLIEHCEKKFNETGDERYLIAGKFGIKYTKNRSGEKKQLWLNHQIERGRFW